MSERDNAKLLLANALGWSTQQRGYITTEEIARLIVEKRGPEDASAIAHWINEIEKDENQNHEVIQ